MINFPEAASDNGPITGYRIIVTCSIAQLSENDMPNYHEAVRRGIPYYVAAQLDADVRITWFSLLLKKILGCSYTKEIFVFAGMGKELYCGRWTALRRL